MDIEINAPGSNVAQPFLENAEERVQSVLSHHASKLSRVQVFLKDLNAHKGGMDKHCVVEARPRGMDPVAADHTAGAYHEALEGAVEKLKRVLDSRFGKLESRKHDH